MGFYRAIGILLCLFSASSFSATQNLSVWLDNQVYTLQLDNHLPAGTKTESAHASHYKGTIVGVDSSWARISQFGNSWEGVVSLNGELFVIDINEPQTKSRSLASVVITGQPATDFEETATCDLHPKTESISSAVSVKSSALSLNAKSVQAATFNTLCSSTVDGLCLLAEIDFVFDQSFQALNPTTYEAKAEELINIIEGYYRNELNIAFEALTTTFLSSEVFTTSTDSLVVLNDISQKKDDNSLAFVSKNEALIQVITGRDFDGSTVGVAWLEGLCDASGYWSTSTAQVVGNSIPLTGLVAAHEIGHNLGAGHDGTGNACPNDEFIMGPVLDPFITEFSTCSVAYIQSAISNVADQDSCFNYPYDIEISETNASNSLTSANVNRTFRIDAATASRSITQATISGTITDGDGTFTSVSIDSTNCTIAAGSQSYSCTLASPSSNHTLTANLAVTTDNYSITHTVAVSQLELTETDSTNNSQTDIFAVVVDGEAEEEPEVVEEPATPATAPEPTNESSESSSDDSSSSESNSNDSSSSGGGGGSLGVFGFLLMALLIFRKRNEMR